MTPDPRVLVHQNGCHGCEQRPIRETGEYVSRVETWTDQRLYCQQCADECAAGLWESDADA